MGIVALTEDQTYWVRPTQQLAKAWLTMQEQVSNLANASALLYHSFLGCSLYGAREDGEPVVNWSGTSHHARQSCLSS